MQAIYFLLGNSNSDNYGSIQRIRDEQEGLRAETKYNEKKNYKFSQNKKLL